MLHVHGGLLKFPLHFCFVGDVFWTSAVYDLGCDPKEFFVHLDFKVSTEITQYQGALKILKSNDTWVWSFLYLDVEKLLFVSIACSQSLQRVIGPLPRIKFICICI